MTLEMPAWVPHAADESALLVRLAKAGDNSAFERLVVEHERKVFLTALRMLGQPADAQDAAQEVFLRLHRHLKRLDEARAVGPWLYQVTVNVCRDLLRRRRPLVDLEEVRETLPSPEADAGRAEQRRLVVKALAALPERERAALVLRDLEGLGTEEVARILGSSEATIRSQVAKARIKIQRMMRIRR